MMRMLLSGLILIFGLGLAPAQPPAVVHAVLFYSPACDHCHSVIKDVLPPLVARYGEQLNIVGIDVSHPQGQVYFQAALAQFQLTSAGVPLLVVGDTYLMGSRDIPEQFPALIDHYLALGGVPVPDLADLRTVLATPAPAEVPTTAPAIAPAIAPVAVDLPPLTSLTPWERLAQDWVGNGLAVLVLVGMVGVAGLAAVNFPRWNLTAPRWHTTLVPVLAVLGLAVAGYLAYVETTQVAAVCGPVGDCNTVQQSEYARLGGVLPIGVLGVVGYAAILGLWVLGRLARPAVARSADLLRLVFTSLGLAFSIYLTFLEPFVIGATCIWCITSAILMTALFWLALTPGRRALTSLGA